MKEKRVPFIAGVFAAAFIGLSACSPKHEATHTPLSATPTATRASGEMPTKTNQQIVEQEIKRLAGKYPQDSIIRRVYSGEAPVQLSPIFKELIEIGFIGSVAYARTHYSDAKLSEQKRFRYFLERDFSLEDYSTLESIKISIAFSSDWLESKNDEVKDLALEKEAIGLALFEGFSKIALNTYLLQGKIDRIDPNVTDQEIARTLAYVLLAENPDVNKLFDYAAYLLVLQKVERLIIQNNANAIQELRASNFATIYQMAKDRSIPFEQIKPWSREFWDLAFNPQSPWVKMILDPSIQGPSKLIVQ